ncbi:hypothetical protein SAMN02745121_07670 [Nannocystis exedens]|uniref:Ferritin-like domain-containing protein n=1 Tax=Nannocystis exedens TaxID=54 RepID=A0A1I2H4D9_9BACT|nr:ferritin-like domain-containing protein [Nannocystis exedens]PCC67106.1 ferritin [Nannocystis exedens]SFF23847.1 hypothetical protein SAMN02745121_07670 [Nannocystis exedens]
MPGARRLTLLFASLLTEVATAGCGGGDDCLSERVTAIGTARLTPFLEDGKLTPAECQALCPGEPPPGPPEEANHSSASSAGPAPGDTSTTAATTGSTTTDTSTTAATAGVVDARAAAVVGCSPIPGNTIDIRCQYGSTSCKGGRRPTGLCSEGRSSGADLIAQWFAEVAHLEAASVPAFERLAAELRGHGAPADLIAAALRAAVDEARHADLLGAVATRLGGRPAPVELACVGGRSLADLAIENAVEGCVGETWGALLAAHQARAAEDPELRACMAEIAVDEAAHAALAWAIDAWIAPRLSADERARVLAARSRAALALRDPPPLDEALERRAGLPPPDRARRLWRALDRELWCAEA